MPSPTDPSPCTEATGAEALSTPEAIGETAASSSTAGAGKAPEGSPLPRSLGGYRIVGLLGQGGMGAVYHAHDDRLDRPVALKTMRREIAAQPGAVQRFLREARVAAQLSHDNVIPIWQVGEDGGVPFIAMPLLQGEPLDAVLKRGGPCPIWMVLKVGREVADGLAAAHARGLVHRDIKPANLWVEGDPTASKPGERFRRIKILDFGLARPAADDSHLTVTGVVVGTPAYMSPEQGRGDPVDFRTDLFSLGGVLYRMATGQQAFRGSSVMAVLVALATRTPASPTAVNPDVPPALSDLIMRLLAKDPAGRPASAAAIVAELQGLFRSAARKTAVPAQSTTLPAPPVRAVPLAAPSSAARPAARSAARPTAQPVTPPAAPQPNPFAELDTVPGLTSKVRPKVRPRRHGRWVAVGLGAVALVLAVATVVIRITGRDGKQTTIEVPDGSTVKVGPRGDVAVTLPKDAPTSVVPRPLAPNPLDQRKRQALTPPQLALAGAGDPAKAAPELVGVIGDPSQAHAAGPTHQSAVRANGLGSGVWDVALSPDGKTLAVATIDKTVRLFDLAAWQPEQLVPPGKNLAGHTGEVGSVTFSPDGSRLASAGLDDIVILWEVATGKKLLDPFCRCQHGSIPAFSPDGGTLAVPQPNGGVALFDSATGDQKAAWTPHSKRTLATAFSPDGKWLASSGEDGKVVVADAQTGKVVRALEGGCYRVAFAPDGKTLYSVVNGSLRAWDTATWKERPVFPGHNKLAIDGLAVHPGGQLVATGARDGSVVVRDVPTGRAKILAPGDRANETHRVNALAFMPDGKYLVAGSVNGSVWVFRTPELPTDPPGPPSPKPIDLLTLVDPARDTVRGQWQRRGTDLQAITGGELELPYQPPEEYDLTVELTLNPKPGALTGLTAPYARARNLAAALFRDQVGQLCGHFSHTLGGSISGGFGDRPPAQARQRLRVEVRKRRAKLYQNGKGWQSMWDGGALHPPGLGVSRDGSLPGLWTQQGAVFHKAELVEVSGAGWSPYGPRSDVDRKAAVWVISLGGMVRVKAGNQERDVGAIADLPKESFTVLGINLDGKGVTEGGMANLKGCTGIRWAVLHYSGVTDHGLMNLADSKGLQSLYLNGTPAGDAGIAFLESCKELETLFMDGTRVTDAGLEHLKGCARLADVRLAGARVSDAGLAHLKDCTNLRHISFDGTGITGTGFAAFKDLGKLEGVRCDGSGMTDEGLAHLKRAKNLKGVNPTGTRVTAKGAADLHAAVPSCRVQYEGGTLEPKK